jgi:glycosyltransferase involved in cell wall biosynthesis
VHDLAFELDPMVRHRPGSRELRRLVSQSARWATRLVAVSSQTKTDVEALYGIAGEKITIVYNGLNPAYVPESDRELRASLRQRHGINRPYVIAVGSDIPRRNYGRMLHAMQIAWQTLPQHRLLLAGHNPWVNTPLYEQARQAHVLDRLYLIHSPTDRELAQLYRDAVVTCCASSFEGFGLSVLESLACGTPVTCSDMGSLREVAEDAALYFPHDDAAAMGESIVGLIEDAEYRRQLRYRGMARARLFTWQTAANLILQTLQKAHDEDH